MCSGAEFSGNRAVDRRDDRLTRLTKDQSFVRALVDSGTMTPAEAENSPQKNIILSAFGQDRAIEPVIGEIEHGDYLLLCSEGLTNMVKETEIRDILSRRLTMSETCRLLVELANRRGGDYNITVISAQVFGRGIPSAADEVTVARQYRRELF